jgi:translocation and assembly module TamA
MPKMGVRMRRRVGFSLLALLAAPFACAELNLNILGIEGPLRQNVQVFLSLERYKNRDDLDAALFERLVERVDQEVAGALRPFGYYEPTVETTVSPGSGNDRRVTIRVTPGPPVLMTDVQVKVDGVGANEPAFQRIARADALRPGQRLSHAAYDSIKGDLLRTAATLGFLDAELTRSELRVDPRSREAAAQLAMTTGARYRFGATTIEQSAIDDSLLRRYLRYEPDEAYDGNQLLRTQFALDDSQYFANVEVTTGDPDRENHIVPVSIKAEANRRNRYSYGAGFGTDTGARGTATWDNRLVNRRGHRMRVEGKAAQKNQSAEARYQIPIGDPAIEKLTFEAGARQEERADLDLRTLELEPSVTHLRGSWQRVISLAFNRTTTITPASATVPKTRAVDTLAIPSISFVAVPQGYLGEGLYSRGTYLELRGSTTAFGAPANYLQARVELERVFELPSPQWHLLLRGQIGASLVNDSKDLPGTERFFAGGDRSVRGFSYNDLSPVIDGNKVGGKHFVAGTVEIVRDLPRNMGLAAFADAGNAFNKFETDVAVSVGLGFRWRLPVLTLGIDLAQAVSIPQNGAVPPPSRPGPRLHLNFSPKL